MELPIVQYKRHRLAYSVAAVLGLVTVCVSLFMFAADGASSVLAWIMLIIGFIISGRCGWLGDNESVSSHMAAYASVYQISFEGIEKKEI